MECAGSGFIAHARILVPKFWGGADNNTCVRDPGKNGTDVCSHAQTRAQNAHD